MVDGIALAPAFEYLPPPFEADAEHARIVAFVRANHARLGGGPLELGEQGRTAQAALAELIAAGARRVVVIAAHPDPCGAEALRAAAARLALPVVSSAELPAWRPLLHASPEERCPGAPWAVRYGLEREDGAARLLERARAGCPTLLPWVEAVLRFARLGVHPLAEVFSGNGLVERNPDYLENLRP